MSTLIVASRLVLTVVFALAAVAKLANRAGAASGAKGLGVPPALAGFTARVLPWAELTVVAGLVIGPTSLAGAGLALFLLVVFTALVALNLGRGRRPACHCLGGLGNSPIGWTTLARNVALMVAATVVLVATDVRPPPLHRAVGEELSGLGVSPGTGMILAALLQLGLVLVLCLRRRRRRSHPGGSAAVPSPHPPG